MRKIALSKQILDRPSSSHKSHSKPIPYLGGVAILIGVISVSYLALLLNSSKPSEFLLATSLLVPAVAMGVIGLLDDLKNLAPFPRFIGQTISGIAVATILVINDSVANPTGSTFFDVLITVLWIVGICNSINFFDNLDGGAAGATAITSIFLTYLAASNGQFFIAALSAVVSGATLGFLIWNRSPAKIYMGDAGALFLGVLVATLTIRLDPITQTRTGSLATPILLLAIPILDTSVAVLSRIYRGISPFQGGKDHLSHRLIRAGISRRTAAVILWLLSILFGTIALALTLIPSEAEIILVITALSLWLLIFFSFFRTSDQ
jgi:UDP-GlcNAc:undecaprenyl-phosphate GlcNAc-1-phosphate transferase